MPKRNGPGIELLADPTRRQIVSLIARGIRRPSHIAGEIGRSRPAVSRQLRLLDEAGLIEAHRHPGDGRGYSYFMTYRMAVRIVAWLAGTGVGLPTRLETVPPLEPARADVPVGALPAAAPAAPTPAAPALPAATPAAGASGIPAGAVELALGGRDRSA